MPGGSELPCPDGIEDSSLETGGALHQYANPLSPIVLGTALILAIAGVFGGWPSPTQTSVSDAATLSVIMPRAIRNGEFFEARIQITPRVPVKKLVVGISPSIWRDITINSMIPAANSETSEDGLFRFTYGEAGAGTMFELKIDGQINPSLFAGTEGEIVVLDDRTALVRLPLLMRVMP